MRLCGKVSDTESGAIKEIIEADDTSAAADDDPTLTVDLALLEKACNVKDKSARDSIARLRQLASLAKLARRGRLSKAAAAAPTTTASTRPFTPWSTQHDLELLTAVFDKGLEEAPAVVLAALTSNIGKQAAAHLAAAAAAGEAAKHSTSGDEPVADPRALAEAELRKKLAARAQECLKHTPGPHGGGSASAAARLGGGAKRLGKPLASAKKKHHHEGGSGGDSDDDFKRKKSRKAEAANGKAVTKPGAADATTPHAPANSNPIRVDDSLTIKSAGSYVPNLPAYRPRDSASSSGARLVYPVGYTSETQWGGRRWRCEIRESKGGPLFLVLRGDGTGKPFESAVSPSDVWRQVCD